MSTRQERSEIAKRAAMTRKRRVAGRKAAAKRRYRQAGLKSWETRRKNEGTKGGPKAGLTTE